MDEHEPGQSYLLIRAAAGDAGAWGSLLALNEARLTRVVRFRMDSRLRGRVDAEDVVQEAFVEAAQHAVDYFKIDNLPLFVWLRGVVWNKLLETHRTHFGAQMRDVRREAQAPHVASPDDTSIALIDQLTDGGIGPGTRLANDEAAVAVRTALATMNAMDREVLALRHFEQLSNEEAAQVLGIQERAAAKRYLRALDRLRHVLSPGPESSNEPAA